MIKTQAEVRKSFWEAHPQFQSEYKKNKRQNEYYTDIRCSFVDYVDSLQRGGEISQKLSENVTL